MLLVVYLWSKRPSAAQLVAAFNPASPDNLANKAVNGAIAAMTGDTNQTLGGAIFDLFNPSAGLAKGETSSAPGWSRWHCRRRARVAGRRLP